jgi:hypothetical protein
MKQIGQFCIALFAIYGFFKLLELIFSRPALAPTVNVTVNLPDNQPKDLKAGDHVKGLMKIAWDKTCEKIISPI